MKEKNTDGLLKNDFETRYMCKIEADPVGEYTKLRKVGNIMALMTTSLINIIYEGDVKDWFGKPVRG